ncbi:MAG: Cna B-type domain-containing protein [Lachnospiraceae bacterium]|nr:Cna B-type domain-containing protein [Lachnospiraceae bacterium]
MRLLLKNQATRKKVRTRIAAFMVALLVLISTVGSNFYAMKAYAAEEGVAEEVQLAQEAAAEPAQEAPAQEEAPAEPAQEAPVQEEAVAEPVQEAPAQEETPAPVQEAQPSQPETPAAPAEEITLPETIEEVPAQEAEEQTEEAAEAEKTEETAQEAPAEEEKAYPAATWTGETADVRVSASVGEGVFPEGTEMRVSPVSAQAAISAAQKMTGESTEIVDAVAVDITFHYDGKEIQPQGAVNVQLFAKRAVQGESHNAVTIDDHGNAAPVADASSRTSAFDTDHFTVYGIVGGNYTDEDVQEHVRHTYIFYVDDVKVDEVIVHNGDAFTVPANPAGDAKHKFAGWYEIETDASGTAAKEGDAWKLTTEAVISAASYDKVADDETEDRIIYVAAKFDTQYTITIYTNEDQKVVFDTDTGEDEETIELTSPDEAMKAGFPVPAGETLTGWKNVDPDGAQVSADNTIKIDGDDIELVPVFAAAHTVSFDKVKTLFEDYQVPDQRVLDGEKVTAPDVFKVGSVYRGYRFDGWYDKNPDEYDDAKEFNFDDKLTTESPDAFTLYAKWTPQEVQIKVEIWLENANDTGYTRHATDDTFKVEADGTIPLDEILKVYHDNKYRTPKDPGYFHLNGTKSYEQNPDATEQLLSDNRPAVEISDSRGEVAKYSVAEVNGGSYDAAANPDGTTVVRINYSRDTYNLKFAFYNTGGFITDANGSQVLNEDGKKLAPEGYANVELPTLRVKYGQHLYKRTHFYSDCDGAMFDAYLKTQPWFFEKSGMDTGGQTVFDESNQNYPIRPASDIGDGGELGVRVYLNGDQKNYPIESRFYDEAWTAEQVVNGEAGAYSSETRTVVYLTDHPHEYTIGASGGGYRLVQITNFGSVQLNKAGDYQALNGQVIANGTHKFKWINGNNRNEECEPIILHYMPVSYTITFKQTRGGTVNGGRLVDGDTKVNDIVLGPFFYDQEINIAALMAANERFANDGWTTLKDANGVVYSAKDGWQGNVDEEGNFPVRMPAQNLVFYKEWECDTYTVTFDWSRDGLPDGTEKVFTEENIAYGDAVKNPADADKAAASREGYVLLGWKAFERNADGTKGAPISDAFYSFNTPVTKNLYIEAQWASVNGYNGYNVVYDKGAHGTVSGADEYGKKEDPQKYDSKANAPVKYIATPEEGWVFTGWAIGKADENSTLYGSGSVFYYTEAADAADGAEDSVLTLIAQYEKIERLTDVTYHTNFPEGIGQTERYLKLEKVAVWNDGFIVAVPDTELGFPRRVTVGDSIFEFVAWTNTEGEKIFTDDSNREYFDPGETAAAGIKDNHLYATWRVIELTTLTVNKVWSDAFNADGSRPASVTIRVMAGGVEAARVTLSAENSWTHTFTGLDASKTYTVEEVDVPAGYTVSYSGNAQDGFTVTNAHTPVTPPTPPTPVPPTPVPPTPVPPTPVPPIPEGELPDDDPDDVLPPIAEADAPAVLGVLRRTDADATVFGARRGKTGESRAATADALAFLFGSLALTALIKGKKKEG